MNGKCAYCGGPIPSIDQTCWILNLAGWPKKKGGFTLEFCCEDHLLLAHEELKREGMVVKR